MSFEKRNGPSALRRTTWFAFSLAFVAAAVLEPGGPSRANDAPASANATATPTASPCPSPPGPLSTPVPC